MSDCKDCLYSKRIDHYEHGAWHEYVCTIHKDIQPGGICMFGCVPTRPTGGNTMATMITCDMCGRIIETRRKENYYKISCLLQTGYINSDIKHPTFCKDLCLDCANAVQEFIEANSSNPLV